VPGFYLEMSVLHNHMLIPEHYELRCQIEPFNIWFLSVVLQFVSLSYTYNKSGYIKTI